MLTKADFDQNVCVIAFSCKLGIIPLQLDLQYGKLELSRSKWKQTCSTLYFELYVAHATYMVSRLPNTLLHGTRLPLLYLILHFALSLGPMAVTFWHFIAFFCGPAITVTCFNKAFDTWGFHDAGKCLHSNSN